MAYDAAGRLRGNGDPGYFESRDPYAFSDYNSAYPDDEPRDNNPSSRRRDREDRSRASPLHHDRITSSTDRFEGASMDGVSPEVIAALRESLTEQITERVKKELVEHLKQTGSVDGQTRDENMQREHSRSSSSPSPPPRRVYTPPSPIQSTRTAYGPPPPMDSRKSPLVSPLEKSSGVRFSDREPRTRPAPSGRTYSTVELSTIDQKWGRLFDNHGTPTQRLGAFLRGLANHIVDDFSPKKSIVVTPAKLATYYSNYSVGESLEPHPFLTIFRVQANEQISQLYRDIGCQHHLVQDDFRNEPTIPALTPLGFAHFMTVIILAYPGVEWKRLEMVVKDLPIDADGAMVDGKPERLPKQISRHLLPEGEDSDSRKMLDDAVRYFYENLGTSKKSKPTITSPSLSRHSSTTQANQSNAKSQPIERERKPYAGTPSTSAIKEEAVKIERDRQPYSAQPGNGKVHEEPNQGTKAKLGRANSTSRTKDIPDTSDARHHRTQSTTNSNYTSLPRERVQPNARRNNSPPLRSFRNSEPIDLNAGTNYSVPPPPPPSASFVPPYNQSSFSTYNTGPSTSFPPPPPPIDIRHRSSRDERDYPPDSPDDSRFANGEFNSPRDAERYDRYHDGRSSDTSDHYGIPYERGSVTIDPEERGAPVEEWYRDTSRGPGYYGTRGNGY
ncbi:hypothetical protein HYALB_00008835 [Hymenoscyphus albidus]|uniref:DUF7514 domain-containing protein n=1 Tax=Hymenoscyphus albidus TaxID=595503 RepID=A0A9N9LZL2_9HELO|nr:hypothetical protein HYALB_00008835 [Hymenoscyphus albidus]